jgi:predicted nucleic acid-binding protein
MNDRWVVNASPLIVMGKVGCLDLLTKLSKEVVVPGAVVDEIRAGPQGDAARAAIEDGIFKLVEAPEPTPELAAWDLGAGETSVLSFALNNPGWTAILDDSAARKCAITFGVDIKGTLAIVILAKKRGLIPSAKQLLNAMQQAGLRLEDKVIRRALEEIVDESW